LSASAVANELSNIFAEKGVKNRMGLAIKIIEEKKK